MCIYKSFQFFLYYRELFLSFNSTSLYKFWLSKILSYTMMYRFIIISIFNKQAYKLKKWKKTFNRFKSNKTIYVPSSRKTKAMILFQQSRSIFQWFSNPHVKRNQRTKSKSNVIIKYHQFCLVFWNSNYTKW